MAKVGLRKYQRNLIPFFKKYQLTELEGDRDQSFLSSSQVLGSTAQQLLDNNNDEEELRNKKLNLTETVKEFFDSGENLEDLAILYEVTGYQGDALQTNLDFWSNYSNFKTLGAAQIAINEETYEDGYI